MLPLPWGLEARLPGDADASLVSSTPYAGLTGHVWDREQFCLTSWPLLIQQAAPDGRYCNGPAEEHPGTVPQGHREARAWATQEPAEQGPSRVAGCSGGSLWAGRWAGRREV